MHILIVKTSSLGDIVQCFPVIDFLRSKFPGAIIDWVVESPFSDLLETHPDIRRVIKVATKDWRRIRQWSGIPKLVRELRMQEYDVVFDLQGNVKSGLVTWVVRSKHKVGFGWSSVSERPNLLFTHHRYDPPREVNVRYEYLYLVQSYFQDFTPPRWEGICLQAEDEKKRDIQELLKGIGKRRKVLVCPGSAWTNKRVSRKSLSDFLSLLQPHLDCDFLLTWGNAEEKQDAEEIKSQLPSFCHLMEKLPLPSLQYLMDSVDLIIAMDSLPLHLGATTSTPTFSVFGASSARKYQPLGERHMALQGTCPYGQSFERRCPVLRTCPTGACVKNFTGLELFQAFVSKDLTNLRKAGPLPHSPRQA